MEARSATALNSDKPGRILERLCKRIVWPLFGVWLMSCLGGGGAGPAFGGEAPAPHAIVADMAFEFPKGQKDIPKWESLACDLVDLRKGELFSDEALQQSVAELEACRQFKSVEPSKPESRPDGVHVRIRLVPYPRIKEIRITGAFPILEREILNAMTIYTGDAYIPESLPEQREHIIKLYKREGYGAPRVDVFGKQDDDDGDYLLTVRVFKGPFYRVREVRVEGNQAFSDARLKLRTQTWKASLLFGGMQRFVQRALDADVRNLTKFYREKGYPEVVVTPQVSKDPESYEAVVVLGIEEGPLYEIEFIGNSEFWDWTLCKDMVVFTEGNQYDFGLKKSVRKIRDRYRQSGYLKIAVTTESALRKTDAGPVRDIRLRIDEGPRSIVEKVTVSGNGRFDDRRIREQMLTRPPGTFFSGAYVPETLEEDARAVAFLYLQAGYRGVAVDTDIQHRLDTVQGVDFISVNLKITEGLQTRVARIKIAGVPHETVSELFSRIALQKDAPYSEEKRLQDKNTIAAAISEQGYPKVDVSGTVHFSPDKTEADVVFTVQTGPHMKMGHVHPIGNFRTAARIIEDEVEMDPGAPFSLKEMLASQRNLQNVNAFAKARVRPAGLKEEEDTVHLIVDIEEKKPYYFETSVGYNTKKAVYANARIGDHNLLGLNKDAWVGGELSQIGYRVDAGLAEPRVLWTRIKGTLNVYAEETREFNKSFGARTQGASLLFTRTLFENYHAGLGFRYELRDQFQRTRAPIPEADKALYEPRGVLVTTPGVSYDDTDSYIRPRRGLLASFSVDISSGLLNSLDDFNKYILKLRYYYTPFERLTLAFRCRGGFTDPRNAASVIPEDQLFFLGGVSDVRGFAENKLRYNDAGEAVGGRTELLGSVEARYDVGLNFEVSGFYDVGAVRDPLNEDGLDDARASVGVGLRYHTPIGPVGFMYGHKLGRRPGESPGAFHFSIGYTF